MKKPILLPGDRLDRPHLSSLCFGDSDAAHALDLWIAGALPQLIHHVDDFGREALGMVDLRVLARIERQPDSAFAEGNNAILGHLLRFQRPGSRFVYYNVWIVELILVRHDVNGL